VILEPEYLDQLYREWLIKDRQSSDPDWTPNRWHSYKNYQCEYRNSPKQQRFEDWLFSQGFTVIQQDGKRYLKFSGEGSKLTFFLLKHGLQHD